MTMLKREGALARASTGLLVSVVVLLSASQWVSAGPGFTTGFEQPTYGLGDLNGQDSWYNPDPPNSVSGQVYTYAGNPVGMDPNPLGGDQFVAGTGPAGGMFSRSQRDQDYSGLDEWTFAYDMAASFTGSGAAAQNIGSFSLQPSTTSAALIHLGTWVDVNNPVAWNAFYIAYDAAGNEFAQPGQSPGAEWGNLPVGKWYRGSTTVNFATNQITEVAITDLVTMQTTTVQPVDWYLRGGAAGGFPRPTGYRLFAGSSTVAGNTLGIDNLSVVPEPGALALLLFGTLALVRRR